MSGRHSSNTSNRDKPSTGRADLRRLRRMSELEIARTSPEELADLPPDFWDSAVLVLPEPKQAVSLRLDREVLEWFRRGGPRYQTRMNAVLRSYVERQVATAEPGPKKGRGRTRKGR